MTTREDESTIWLSHLIQKKDKIISNLDNSYDSKIVVSLAGLKRLEDTAKKLDTCSVKCRDCQKLMVGLEEYLTELEKLLHDKKGEEVNTEKIRMLKNQRFETIGEHLIRIHGYKLKGVFKVRYTFLGILLGVLLAIIVPQWYLIFSWISVIVGYVVGYKIDQYYIKNNLFVLR